MVVEVREPERMSLPGLLAARLLEHRLARGAKVALRGDVLLDVAGAAVTLRFRDDRIEITRAPAVEPVAEIHTTYGPLVELAAGRPLRALRSGMRVRGRPGVLLALVPLLRGRRLS